MPETPNTLKQEIKLFYCYAHEDKALRDELQINLSGLRRQYQLTNWYDREILPGEQWEEAIDKHLSTADVILLLISPHFVDSDYCYGKEMQRALERHHAGSCCVIPILLRPTYWEDTPLSTIQMLPTDARPITSWPDRYEAFHDVARGIGTTIKAMLTARSNKSKGQWLKEGHAIFELKRYQEEQASPSIVSSATTSASPASRTSETITQFSQSQQLTKRVTLPNQSSVPSELAISSNPQSRRHAFSSISGGIVLIGLALASLPAFLLGRGEFFLPIFFVALAFAALFGSLSSGNPRAVYGGIQGFFWLLGLAFCLLFGFWPWLLVVVGISIILGALIQPILAGLLGIGFIAAMQSNRQPQQQYQQPYQPYQQPQQTPPTYVEGEQEHQYPPQPKQEYDQPQPKYPQEMPPQQQ